MRAGLCLAIIALVAACGPDGGASTAPGTAIPPTATPTAATPPAATAPPIGEEWCRVPDLVGLTLDEARAAWAAAGFRSPLVVAGGDVVEAQSVPADVNAPCTMADMSVGPKP